MAMVRATPRNDRGVVIGAAFPIGIYLWDQRIRADCTIVMHTLIHIRGKVCSGPADETFCSRHVFIPGEAMISRQAAPQESSTMNRIIRTVVFALACVICMAPTFVL